MHSKKTWLAGTAAVLLISGCAHDFGSKADGLMNAKFIKEQFGATIPDLGTGSLCPGGAVLAVTVIEERKGRRTLSGFPGIYVMYEDFAASVQRYFTETLAEAKVRVVAKGGGPEVQVRVEDASISTGWGPAFGKAKLAVAVPQWNHTAAYTGEETSGTIQRAIAYSVHEAVLGFLKDPLVQRQLRCTERS